MVNPRDVAESYWRAECARDVEAVLEHYANDATFTAPGWNARGHDEIRKYYEESGELFPGLEVTVRDDITAGNRAAVEWDAVLIDRSGGRHPLSGVNLITVENGKFRTVRAYFDPSGVPGWDS